MPRLSRLLACLIAAGVASGCDGSPQNLLARIHAHLPTLVSNAEAAPPPTGTPVTVTVDANRAHPISPWIYGLNFLTSMRGAPAGATFDRAGGNRWTAYNWTNNASNAGSDYRFQSDTYLSQSSTPGAPVIELVRKSQAAGRASLFTVQLQGHVAADTAGPVSPDNGPDPKRFKPVVFRKADHSAVPFTRTPPASEEAVYMDEFVAAIDAEFAGKGIFSSHPSGQPVFVELDNEPELWPHTHQEIQGKQRIPASTYIERSIALAKALKDRFPELKVFAPAHYGFVGIYSWQEELHPSPGGNDWFVDLYLQALHDAAARYGRPLVDVYDLHWYPEVRSPEGQRVIDLNGRSLSEGQVQAIVQAPRSLWDASYEENSWISHDVLHGPIDLLHRLKSRIDRSNPGMGMAITEYNPGGQNHIAGTVAEADYLGGFGATGLFAANYWMLGGEEPYPLAGFRAYRDFDGAGSNFGDISLATRSSDPARVSAYASRDSTAAHKLVMVLINRSASAQEVSLQGLPAGGSARAWRIDAESAGKHGTIAPVAAGQLEMQKGGAHLALPPLSVTTLDLR